MSELLMLYAWWETFEEDWRGQIERTGTTLDTHHFIDVLDRLEARMEALSHKLLALQPSKAIDVFRALKV